MVEAAAAAAVVAVVAVAAVAHDTPVRLCAAGVHNRRELSAEPVEAVEEHEDQVVVVAAVAPVVASQVVECDVVVTPEEELPLKQLTMSSLPSKHPQDLVYRHPRLKRSLQPPPLSRLMHSVQHFHRQ